MITSSFPFSRELSLSLSLSLSRKCACAVNPGSVSRRETLMCRVIGEGGGAESYMFLFSMQQFLLLLNIIISSLHNRVLSVLSFFSLESILFLERLHSHEQQFSDSKHRTTLPISCAGTSCLAMKSLIFMFCEAYIRKKKRIMFRVL